MIRPLDPHFAVAPQLIPNDLVEIAREGYAAIINNRPDGEEAGQPTGAAMRTAAEAAAAGYDLSPVAAMIAALAAAR